MMRLGALAGHGIKLVQQGPWQISYRSNQISVLRRLQPHS